MRSVLGAALVAAILLVCKTPAFAGPPYETDDPAPTDYRSYEIYAFGDRATPSLELNYGLLRNVQFSVSFDDGIHKAEVGVKYRFVTETPARPQVSFYPSLSDGKVFLPVWAQKSAGNWTVFGGGGVTLDPAVPGGHSWSEGIAITRDLSPRTNVGVELFHTGAADEDPAHTDVGLAWIHELGDVHALLFGADATVSGGSALRAYGAYEWRLGPAQ